jgi:SAM-dependent methyltransferase
MLLEAGAAHLLAVEPSAGVETLRKNLAEFGDRVEGMHATGDSLPRGAELDYVFSIGVVQFIPEPLPVPKAMRDALRPGGEVVLWVYSQEGNRAYLAAIGALRAVTTRLPHPRLSALCSALNALLDVYMVGAKLLPLPKHRYIRTTLSKFSRRTRRLVICDQLNPSYVNWYSREEVEELVRRAGFGEPRLHHRHGYSWTAVARKPSG